MSYPLALLHLKGLIHIVKCALKRPAVDERQMSHRFVLFTPELAEPMCLTSWHEGHNAMSPVKV
jgi:hypothetical protein